MRKLPLISDDFIRRTGLPDGRDNIIYRDRRLVGFQLRIRRKANGALVRTFQVEHKGGGRSRRKVIVIGDATLYSVDGARDEAAAILKAVGNGDDPKAIRRARRDAPTWELLVADFDAEHIAEKAPGSQKDYRGRIRRNLTPFFKGTRVADITPDMVAAFKRRKRANPTDANRSLAVLSVMMNMARAKGWRADNPVAGVKRNRERPREDWLDEVSLPKFLGVLQVRPEDAAHDLLRFLLISGWRVSEARLLQWVDLDLSRMVARIATKTGVQKRQLSTDAAAVIDRQGHRVGTVFSGRSGGFPVAYRRVVTALAKVCHDAGIERISPHVLRHTSATWASVNGADLLELRQAFGWAGLAMPNRYIAKAEALGRQGAEKAATAMNVLGRPTASVRDIRR